MRRMLVVGAVVALAGCGGGGGSAKPEDQIRSTVEGYARDAAAGENGRACERSTDPKKCVGNLILAAGMIGQQSLRDLAKRMKVTSVTIAADGRSAVVHTWGEDSPTKAVKRGDHWLLVEE